VNIVIAYELSDDDRHALSLMPAAELIETIVGAVQKPMRAR
jgi:hypothetical protein